MPTDATDTATPDDDSLVRGLQQIFGGILAERNERLAADPLFARMQDAFARNRPAEAVDALRGRLMELTEMTALASRGSESPLTAVEVERGMHVLLGRHREIRREEEERQRLDCSPRARRRVGVEFLLAALGEGPKPQ